MQTRTDLIPDVSRQDFTVSEILKLQDLGILTEAEAFELVEGEIVPMQAKTHRHELIKTALGLALARALPDNLWIGFETSLYLSDRTVLDPDLVVYPKGMTLEAVKGPNVILVIEVALTSLTFDLGRKAALYARHGIGELWVVDAKRRMTHIHRDAGPDGWASIDVRPPAFSLVHPALPALSVRLDDV